MGFGGRQGGGGSISRQESNKDSKEKKDLGRVFCSEDFGGGDSQVGGQLLEGAGAEHESQEDSAPSEQDPR
jgi:hypothetical protein